ncbi:hypothetical protein FACS189415_0470 [Bacteroidia bacterium]|nr:hypothetical protein FACS189415_0470 [Bacteroidia bacterium]GHV70727.1 hypothetical protein FACS189420_3030 [Bacteroidia bacterium]
MSSMKILYDHQAFEFQKFGGVSRYFAEIISHLPAEVRPAIAVKYSDNVYLKQKTLVENLQAIDSFFNSFLFGLQFKGKSAVFERLKKKFPEKFDVKHDNRQHSIDLLKKQDFDIFHPTFYDDYFLEHIGNKPFVVTVHDMIQELYPELYPDDIYLPLNKANMIKKASHIIAVSEQTKKDIIDIVNIPEEKISVIYHASHVAEKTKGILALPSEYFLFVGERNRYKNFCFFVRAIEPILKQRNGLQVVCTGQPFTWIERRLLEIMGIRKRFVHFFAKEDELFEVYNKAIALVFPSYYEGFGIPILEAFESSCPVLLSDTSCFPEIAKDCALYFPPKDIKQFGECLENVIDNPSLRKSLIDKGKIRAQDFSWPKFANQTYEVYKRVLKNE